MIIDVSEHNGALNWEALKPQIEGAILRCGYGSDIQKQDDKQWTRNVAECERLGIPYGVYLYSYAQTEESARSEASHVLRCLKGHKPGLPVFWDIEENSLQHTARKFFYVFADAIGSAYRVGLYTGEYYYNACCYGIAAKYRWIAKYGTNDGQPHTAPVLRDNQPYQLWQYTSKALSGHMDASQVIDREMLFGSVAVPQKTVDKLAQEVITGQWGAGDDRKNRLTAAGYDYAAVQARVNELLTPAKKSADEIAKEVIAGQWGSGADRKAKLQAAGYDYNAVQAKVNTLLGVAAKPKKPIDQIAREVIAGKWGNNPKRSAALKKKAGYDPAKVQARVNQLL